MHQPDFFEIVRLASRQPQFSVTRWQIETLHVLAMSASTYGMYRLSGQGYNPQNPANLLNWSLILKILKRPVEQSADICQLGYWRREPLVYQSGVLDNLPWELNTPCCFASTEQNEDFIRLFNFTNEALAGTCWLWLEDLAEIYPREWPLALYGQAARELGHLNGSYLTGARPLPNFSWLGRNFLRDYIRLFGANFSRMLQTGGWEHPELNGLFGRSVATALEQLDRQKELFLAVVDKLPQTLTHSDIHRDNFIAYCNPTGLTAIKVIDWADLGVNSLGQDLAALVGLALGAYKDLQTDPFALDELVFAEYIKGLREVGWTGAENLVRLGFTTAIGLRWGHALSRNVGWYLLDGRQEWLERCYGCSIQDCLRIWAHLGHYTLERAAEATRLLDQISLT